MSKGGSAAKIKLNSYDDLFGASQAPAGMEQVQEIPLSELHEFKGHPFKVLDDEKMQETVESIKIIDGIAKDLKAVPEKLKAQAGNVDKKKLFLMSLPYILVGYFCNKIAWLWRVSPGQNASDKMMAAMNGLNDLFANPLPSFFPKDLLIGAGCGVALRLCF